MQRPPRKLFNRITFPWYVPVDWPVVFVCAPCLLFLIFLVLSFLFFIFFVHGFSFKFLTAMYAGITWLDPYQTALVTVQALKSCKFLNINYCFSRLLCLSSLFIWWCLWSMSGISHTMGLLERFHTTLVFYKWLLCKLVILGSIYYW